MARGGRFPTVTGREFIRALQRLGFDNIRQTGSHISLRHPDGRATTVPNHGGADMERGFAKMLLKQAQVSVEDFLAAR